MTNKEKDWIANRCVKAKEKEGIILISHIIEIVDNFNKNRTCEWEVDEDTIYSTSCHNMWQFTEGGLTDNEIKFCPYCGSKIVSTDTKGEEDG